MCVCLCLSVCAYLPLSVCLSEGRLRHTTTGEAYVFNAREDLHRWNQKRYEALGEVGPVTAPPRLHPSLTLSINHQDISYIVIFTSALLYSFVFCTGKCQFYYRIGSSLKQDKRGKEWIPEFE